MNAHRGYYSLIQFCPDSSRMEAVNLGVVLFCPEIGFLDARTSANNRRAEKLVGRSELERLALNAAKKAIERRLEVDRESFQSLDDLEKFVRTRGNWLKLTPPRPMKVFDAEKDLDELYTKLVGGTSLRQARVSRRQLFPKLRDTFQRLHSEGRAELDVRVNVPVLGKRLSVPYAYSNGQLNLIAPHRFSRDEGTTLNAATRLAVEGDLVNRHGTEMNTKSRLVVVSKFDVDANPDVVSRVRHLFSEYHVKNVDEGQIDDFIAEVAAEAH